MEEMQKYSIKAFLLLASFIAPVSVIENSWGRVSWELLGWRGWRPNRVGSVVWVIDGEPNLVP